MRGDLLSNDFRYDSWAFTLNNGQALDLSAYQYLSVEIATGTSLEIAPRNSASFSPFYHRQVIGDSAEGAIGLVRIRNNSGGVITGVVVTSSRRIAWSEFKISGAVTATMTGVDIEGTNADGVAVKTATALACDTYLNAFNGTTWDRVRGDATKGLWVQGAVNSASAHGTVKPVLVGGTDNTNARTMAVDASGNVKVTGAAAHDAAASGSPVFIAGATRTDNPTSLVNGDTCSLTMSTGRTLAVLPYQIPENTWTYAPAVGGIVNTTTAVTVKTAAATGLRNYVTGLDLSWDSLTTATEFAIRDGASGTVLYRHKIVNGAAGRTSITFPVPLKGTAATLVEIVTLTASGTGGVFANLNGFVAP